MDTDDGSSNKFNANKVDGANYGAWNFNIRLLLIHKVLWDFVDESETDQSKDAKALLAIVLSVKDSQTVHIQWSSTSTDAWNKLRNMCESKGVANKMHLWGTHKSEDFGLLLRA